MATLNQWSDWWLTENIPLHYLISSSTIKKHCLHDNMKVGAWLVWQGSYIQLYYVCTCKDIYLKVQLTHTYMHACKTCTHKILAADLLYTSDALICGSVDKVWCKVKWDLSSDVAVKCQPLCLTSSVILGPNKETTQTSVGVVPGIVLHRHIQYW